MTAAAIPIVALDRPTERDAIAVARELPECRFFKVGSTLFTAAGPRIVEMLRGDFDADVFLDLKFHDIPSTVAGAVRSAVAMGVRLLTVHASGGVTMLRAAQDEAGERCGLLGVTILTSLDGASLGSAWGRAGVTIADEVLRFAGDAEAAGLHGVVCGGAEAAAVHERYGRLAVLVPGVRLAGESAHDQRRVVTPASAQRSGARYVVLGRTVTAASDRGAAFRRVLADLSAGLPKSPPAGH